ncbi:NAD(P)/FAD-dependent oxidoreductase [Peptococcaceae bacterium 1198_IL3148]
MKVAIIGAGIAGLACAIELERLGITPEVYEQRYQVGDPCSFPAVMLDLGLVTSEQIRYLYKQYRLKIKPLAKIKRLVLHSPNHKKTFTGQLGHFVEMGHSDNNLHNQLASELKVKINLRQNVDYFKIRDNYDWVVLADGSPSIPIQLNIWQSTFQGWVRGGNMVGEFAPSTAEVWVNREFAREGYAYLAPYNNKAAALTLFVNGISRQELHDYWNTFINKLQSEPKFTAFFELEYQTGRLKKHQVANTIIVGNAGGFVPALWGQGLMMSMISGIEAARSIVKGSNYEQKVKTLIKANERLDKIHQSLNQLDNSGLDMLVKMLKVPGVTSLATTAHYSGVKLISNLISRISGNNKEFLD